MNSGYFEIAESNMKAQMKIALAGGGGASDSRPLDEVFASWVGSQGRLLYWPFALRGIRTFDSCLAWITATFGPLNITDITLWTALSDHQADELDQFAAVYIGGGNTFALLAEIREHGFDQILREYARSGRPVYGGSAGAAVLGRDIRTVSHMDQNTIGLMDTTGLDLAGSHSIWVHYRPGDDYRIQAYVHQHHQPVLAISERSGIVIENDGLRPVGFEPIYRFDTQGKVQV